MLLVLAHKGELLAGTGKYLEMKQFFKYAIASLELTQKFFYKHLRLFILKDQEEQG
ncbi:MAG: hypothetical protein V7K67_01760 [Nostoc sp.]